MKLYKTKWNELQYGNIKGIHVQLLKKSKKCSDWRFFNEGNVVGPVYPSKAILLADMNRYALESWGLS
ncbi:hypothetical protein GW796_08980 [archaeon]|nr:hypothetical protein [archaeon]NCT58865.1 hypothetical protein [archaeon]